MTQRATSERARRGYGRDKRGPPAQNEGRRVTQRATSERARRGYGRDKRGPPAQGRDKRGPPHSKKNRDKGVNGEWAAFWRLA